jgi:hypothetical protein
MSGQLHAPAILPAGKATPVPIINRTPIPRSSSPNVRLYATQATRENQGLVLIYLFLVAKLLQNTIVTNRLT